MLKWLKLGRRSIVFKTAFFMTLVVLMQALFAVGLIMATQAPNAMKDNAYNLFAEKVVNRNNYLVNEMTSRWSTITEFKNEIAQAYVLAQGQADTLGESEITAFLDDSTDILVRMIDSSMTTGGFIILDDSTGDSHSGLYIRNYNPTISARQTDATNLVMLRGPNDISKKYRIPLDNAWTYGFDLDADHIDILRRPIEATSFTTQDIYLGFWHISPSLSNPNSRNITFSLPIFDGRGKAVGVVGVEIAQDYLYKLLPTDEFGGAKSYGYVVASVDPENETITPKMAQGTVQRSIVRLDVPMNLTLENNTYSCYSTPSPLGKVGVHYEEIRIYGPNTPFADTHFALVGLTDHAGITAFSDRLVNMLYLIILVSVVVGFVASCVIAYTFARPIVHLGGHVRQSNLDRQLSLVRTGITEIDDLALAIEQLSRNILDQVTRTDRIMEMADITVGSFEYRQGWQSVIVSTALKRMMGLETEPKDAQSMPTADFFHVLEEFKSQPDPMIPDMYLVSESPKRWFRIAEIHSNGDLLGVAIDSTRDVLERYALNYERDYDALTGICNRSAFHRKIQLLFAQGNLEVAAMTMFDLDNLKYVNDTYGHEAGDLYIKTTAHLLESALQHNALIARISGDEFYVFFHGFSNKQEILDALTHLYRTLDTESMPLPDGTQFKVRMSGGISWYGEDSRDLTELIRYADFAMYEGKHTVKGELRQFNKNVYLAESFMLNGKEELNRVLDNQLIDYVFQPIVDAHTGALYGYEALMRPQSHILNSPDKLIQIATAQSQLWKIEKITFFKALSQYVRYREQFGDARLFLNSVPNQSLKESEYEEFERLYADCLPNVIVEVIENERLDADLFRAKKERFTAWGTHIALDDYGAGYNSDLSLLSIHPYIVKLDRFLTAGVEKDAIHQAMVQKLVSFCKQSGILVLAEGVETHGQMEYLVHLGVDFLQGYFIARPMPLPDFNDAITREQIREIQCRQAETDGES